MTRSIFVLIAAGAALLPAQKPEPFSQLDPRPYDPKTDMNMEMFVSHWRDSPPRTEFGSLVIRDIFTKCEGDPLRPARKGAVLTQFSQYSHAMLYGHASTETSTLIDEQRVFYFYSGKGTATSAGKTAELADGVGLFIPARVPFTLRNAGDAPLCMYVIGEPVSPGSHLPASRQPAAGNGRALGGAARRHSYPAWQTPFCAVAGHGLQKPE